MSTSSSFTIHDLLVMFAEVVPIDEAEELLLEQPTFLTTIDANLLLSELSEQARREVVMWASGYTIDDIAATMHFASSTIYRHLNAAFDTLKQLTGNN